MPVTPEHRKLKQEDRFLFEASLGYMVTSRTIQTVIYSGPGLYRQTLSKNLIIIKMEG